MQTSIQRLGTDQEVLMLYRVGGSWVPFQSVAGQSPPPVSSVGRASAPWGLGSAQTHADRPTLLLSRGWS
jgi:hypothetical protein